MSSFRLKTYLNYFPTFSVHFDEYFGDFSSTLLKIRIIPSPVKHKQTKTTQQHIKSHLKKVDVSRFTIVSNEATHELNSVAVNKQGQNTPHCTKQ